MYVYRYCRRFANGLQTRSSLGRLQAIGSPRKLGDIPRELGDIPGELGDIPGELGDIPRERGRLGRREEGLKKLGDIPGELGDIPREVHFWPSLATEGGDP